MSLQSTLGYFFNVAFQTVSPLQLGLTAASIERGGGSSKSTFVSTVAEGGPAAAAGVQRGDILIAIETAWGESDLLVWEPLPPVPLEGVKTLFASHFGPNAKDHLPPTIRLQFARLSPVNWYIEGGLTSASDPSSEQEEGHDLLPSIDAFGADDQARLGEIRDQFDEHREQQRHTLSFGEWVPGDCFVETLPTPLLAAAVHAFVGNPEGYLPYGVLSEGSRSSFIRNL